MQKPENRIERSNRLIDEVKSQMRMKRASVMPSGITGLLTASFESLNESDVTLVEGAEKESIDALTSAISQYDGADQEEDYTDAQLKAGAIVMQAAEDPNAYIKNATSIDVNPDMNIGTESFTYTRKTASMEAYDDRNIDENMAYSVVWNMGAARQDEFGEAFFPTITATPDKSGLKVSVQVIGVHNDFKHLSNGAPVPDDFGQHSLIDAIMDGRLLKNNSTRLIPVYDANKPYFTKEIAPRTVTTGQLQVETAPLVFGKQFNLLGISQSGLLNQAGVYDSTDSIDQTLFLRDVYLKITDNNGVTSKIKVEVSKLPFAQFIPAGQGRDRDMMLNFENTDIVLNKATTDLSDPTKPAAALTYLSTQHPEYMVRLEVRVNAKINLENGNNSAVTGTVDIASVWQEVGGVWERIEDDAVIAEVRQAIATVELLAFEYDAGRSNINRRNRGLVVRSVTHSEVYMIPLLDPITALKPLTDTPTDVDVTAPIEACRVQNSNAAVEAIKAHAELLKNHAQSVDLMQPVPMITGMGRHLVRPYFSGPVWDALTAVDSLKSHERQSDIAASICHLLRDEAVKMAVTSGYLAALRTVDPSAKKPKLVIGTSPRIAEYIQIFGDPRLFGDAFDYEIVTSLNVQVEGHIYMTFSRGSKAECDPLGYGNMIWIPELVTNVPNTRNGAQSNELMVQPRRRHLTHLACLVDVTVTNLTPIANGKINLNMVQK